MIFRSRRRKKQNGVVAIEFAIGSLAFFMMIFYWIEVSYMGFVSAMVDYAVSEASRVARTTQSEDGNYRVIFKKIIEEDDSGWGSFLEPDDFTLDTNYFASVGDLASCSNNLLEPSCTGGSSQTDSGNKPLAIYRVTYPYQPLFVSLLFSGVGTINISREVISIQEYERDEFLD